MNRRNFIGSLLAAGASFMVLPSSGGIWKAARPRLICPPPIPYPPLTGFYSRDIAIRVGIDLESFICDDLFKVISAEFDKYNLNL